ncbi:MAG TPA: PfkB family carbohydrate kinase, partial [Candidatus Bathyarchaeia archaeon]|nr:PfkB family carbohydrate kinase [Candidatus Bathyarchaeia archaeon]
AILGIRPDERFSVPAFRDPAVSDTTGAGDVFAGSWLLTFLSTKDPIWAASVGSAFASLASRKTGLSKFQLSRKELFRRASWVYDHTKAVPG